MVTPKEAYKFLFKLNTFLNKTNQQFCLTRELVGLFECILILILILICECLMLVMSFTIIEINNTAHLKRYRISNYICFDGFR